MGSSKSARILRWNDRGGRQSIEDWVGTEEPLELRIRGQSIAITMRTPGHDRELAAGFALTERIIDKACQLIEVAHCQRNRAEHPENIINLFLDPKLACDLGKLSRHLFASSSCGICGKASLESIQSISSPIDSKFTIASQKLLSLPECLRQNQKGFQQTGALHAAALFDLHGDLICLREDVGRHNAVDKIIGWGLLSKTFPLRDFLLLVSGRASFEIMQKALAAGISMVAAISAPSSLAVDFAKENCQTLIGFLKSSSFNIYSHPHRVQD